MNEILVRPLLSPACMASRVPITQAAALTVKNSRKAAREIISGTDTRMLAIVGPCSIHDLDAAREYASLLAGLNREIEDSLLVVMRAYFEKPRTVLGWRGLIIDPDMDGSFEIERGIESARTFLVEVNDMGLSAASELLDPLIPRYIGELLSWAAVGARTSESQTHREMASGMDMPVGFKNATDGNVQTAINAIISSRQGHSYVGLDGDGTVCIANTPGNRDAHLILRGGKNGPNYFAADIKNASALLERHGLHPSIIVDCSHGNSAKRTENQAQVVRSLLDQRSFGDLRCGAGGKSPLVGFMLESNLEHGSQTLTHGATGLKRGLSITDPCIGWAETSELLLEAADRLREMRR